VKISPKRADLTQLRTLKRVIQSGQPLSEDRKLRARWVLALGRIMENKYPARLKSRPRKDERNAWLAADYLIRCARPGAKKAAESKELSLECEKRGIKIAATAIRKLPAEHPGAERAARSLIAAASNFRDPHAAALREACGHWLRAEAATKAD
jgi:hypothetical protein